MTAFYRELAARMGEAVAPELDAEMREECSTQAFQDTCAELGYPDPTPEPEKFSDAALKAFGERCVARQLELEDLNRELLASTLRLRAHYDRCALRIWRSVLMQRARTTEGQ